MLPVKWWPFCLGFNVLIHYSLLMPFDVSDLILVTISSGNSLCTVSASHYLRKCTWKCLLQNVLVKFTSCKNSQLFHLFTTAEQGNICYTYNHSRLQAKQNITSTNFIWIASNFMWMKREISLVSTALCSLSRLDRQQIDESFGTCGGHSISHKNHERCLMIRSCKVSKAADQCFEFSIALKFGRCLASNAAKAPAKFQSDISILTPNIVG